MQSNKGAGEKQKKRVSKPVLKHRSSRSEIFCKKCFLRNFAKFTGKHLCQSLFLSKVPGLRPDKNVYDKNVYVIKVRAH